MQQSNGKTSGAILALVAVLFWGLMPVMAKGLLNSMDAWTLNFFRFIVAIVVLGIYLPLKGQRVVSSPLSVKTVLWTLVAVLSLAVNHILFIDALNYIPAGTSQIVVQLGPIGLLLISVFWLRESFSLQQWLGVALFIAGLGLFFNQRLSAIFTVADDYAFGIVYMAVASLVWSFYGVAQKLLSHRVSPPFILLCCYSFGALILFPYADIALVFELNATELWMLALVSMVSLIAYICFAESITRWEATKSSAVLAFIPVAAFTYETVLAQWLPEYIQAETLEFASIAGIVLVVFGCIAVTRTGRRKMA